MCKSILVTDVGSVVNFVNSTDIILPCQNYAGSIKRHNPPDSCDSPEEETTDD